MSIHKSCRKLCPDFIVDDFVTTTIKTVPVRIGYKTIRVTPKSDKQDKTPTFCAQTALSVVCRKGCLVDIVDVVVKSAPRNAKLKRLIPVNALFAREAFFYNTVLVELLEFQQEAGLKDGTKFQGAPTLIAARVDEGEEALVLQNAGAGWVGELTPGHVRVVLREFGRLHGLCLGFGAKKRDKIGLFDELKGGFLSCFDNKMTVKMIQGNLNQVLGLFGDESVAGKLRKFGGEVEGFLESCLKDQGDVSVLLHGDPSDSFLFCYEKTDCNVASSVKLTDWQLVKTGSPVLDLSLFLFTNCASEDLRNLETLLKDYHKTLEEYLSECQCDVNRLFTFEVLLEHWKKYAKFGLALSFLALKVTTADLNRRPNANNEDLSEEEFVENFVGPLSEEFVWRIKDVVKYCVDTGLI